MDPDALLSARAFSATPKTPAGSNASRIKSFERMILLLLGSDGETESPAPLGCLFLCGRCCRVSTDSNVSLDGSLVRVIRRARPKGTRRQRFYLISDR